jgi:hypothetical protein
MAEDTNSTPPAADPQEASKKKKKKQKARGVWISFGGRIVAQVVGAAATIFLGILLFPSRFYHSTVFRPIQARDTWPTE